MIASLIALFGGSVHAIIEIVLALAGFFVSMWQAFKDNDKATQLTSWNYSKYLVVAVLPVTLYNLVVYIYSEMVDLAIYIINDSIGSPTIIQFTGFTGWLLEIFYIESVFGMYISAYSFRLLMRVFRIF